MITRTPARSVGPPWGRRDEPEANLFGLQKLIGAAGFRPDSSKIVVWFGDAPGHDPVCNAVSGEATVTEATVTAALGGDGDTSPDAAWVSGHPNQVQVRAERGGKGDGRVYRIAFTATDGKETCTGTVKVGVTGGARSLAAPAIASGCLQVGRGYLPGCVRVR